MKRTLPHNNGQGHYYIYSSDLCSIFAPYKGIHHIRVRGYDSNWCLLVDRVFLNVTILDSGYLSKDYHTGNELIYYTRPTSGLLCIIYTIDTNWGGNCTIEIA